MTTTTGQVGDILAGIAAAPGEDLGYLVLADALEENGQGNEAELTRLSLALRQPDLVPGREEKERTLQALLATGTTPVVPTLVVPLDDKWTTLPLVLVPGGANVLGELVEGEGGHDSRRAVTLPPFLLGQTSVTQAQWQAVMGTNPSHHKGVGTLPVEKVSWDDAQAFCAKLSALPAEKAAGRRYCLPTEIMWEYACRAGTRTRFYAGDDEADLARAGWFHGNSGGRTHPVGEKVPNAFGLYDMHGNVLEWCQDAWREDMWEGEQGSDPTTAGCSGAAAGTTTAGAAGPRTASGTFLSTGTSAWASVSPSSSGRPREAEPAPSPVLPGRGRVIRGGGWYLNGRGCRSADRSRNGPENRLDNLGFRVALPVSPA